MASDPQDITDTQLDMDCMNNDREALNLVNSYPCFYLSYPFHVHVAHQPYVVN